MMQCQKLTMASEPESRAAAGGGTRYQQQQRDAIRKPSLLDLSVLKVDPF